MGRTELNGSRTGSQDSGLNGNAAKSLNGTATVPGRAPTIKADVEEGDSPRALPTEPAEKVQEEELGVKKNPQSEDQDKDNEDRERDIYSEAVLQCE
jgi:ribonucleoside-diphosphate reductase subunit M1